jgi:tRNA dimethylallyltransferase
VSAPDPTPGGATEPHPAATQSGVPDQDAIEPHPAASQPGLLAVVGATGTGKSDLAVAIARRLGEQGVHAEVVNADAMQLYRGMDIGTAKLDLDERQGVPHRQLDVLEVTDEASVAAYQQAARSDIDEITGVGGVAILTGGSGLYVSSVLYDLRFPGTDPELRAQLEHDHATLGPTVLLDRLRVLDPAAASTIDARNPRRLIRALEIASRSDQVNPSLPTVPEPWQGARVLHLTRERTSLVDALARRAEHMFRAGLVDEVAGLRDRGIEQGRTARAAIGYSQALDVLHGRSDEQAAIDATALATRKYARRQVSWFKRYASGNGTTVERLDMTDVDPTAVSVLARRIVG